MVQTSMISNFDKDVPLLRSIGIECFDIFTTPELSFLTDENYIGGDMHDNLAGHIKKEKEILNWPREFEEKILNAIRYSDISTYEISRYKCNMVGSPLKLSRLWTNFQKKHEFNPVHKHDGVLSFVLFLQIPYNLREEEAVFSANCSDTSKLQFLSINPAGEIQGTHANVDQSYINKLLVFNSKLHHTVYPFYTSDGTRITCSGNFAFDNENPAR